ncbi:MAG: FMN-binding protein [Candidatus Avoscillospira sp.]
MKNTTVKSIVVLVAICLVISAALAIVNSFTAPVIESAAEQRQNASRKAVLPQAAGFVVLDRDGMPDSITSAYKGIDTAANIVGYVFTAARKGFDGTIVVMTAIDPDGKIVNVATIDVTSETKTLGGQTANESYTGQYAGMDSALEGVDAISGATITSTAYRACVMDCFAAFDAVKEG